MSRTDAIDVFHLFISWFVVEIGLKINVYANTGMNTGGSQIRGREEHKDGQFYSCL